MKIDGKEWRLVPVEPTEEMLDAICNAPLLGASPDDNELRDHWRTLLDAAPTPPAATAAAQEPLFWYHPRSDGGYEGPISKGSIEDVRKRSGAWVPLYPGAAPAAVQSQGDEARDAARLEWIERMAVKRKIEIAKSLFGSGFEFGFWPECKAAVFHGTLRECIDAAIAAEGE